MIIAGGYDGSDYRQEILSFNSSLAWAVLGILEEERYVAAAVVVTYDRGQLDSSNSSE